MDDEPVAADDLLSSGDWSAHIRTDPINLFMVSPGEHTVKVRSAGESGWQWNLNRFILQSIL